MHNAIPANQWTVMVMNPQVSCDKLEQDLLQFSKEREGEDLTMQGQNVQGILTPDQARSAQFVANRNAVYNGNTNNAIMNVIPVLDAIR